MREIRQRHGARGFRHIIETSEKLSRAAVAALPDGVYEATDWIDGDGIRNERFPVKVQVRIEGDEMTFDFSECCPQLMGPLNCSSGRPFLSGQNRFQSACRSARALQRGILQTDESGRAAREPCSRPYRPPRSAGTTRARGRPPNWPGRRSRPLVPERFSAGSANSLCVTRPRGS